ncbi:MAG: DUF5117 domain-containing protein [Rhodothermales bacterium]|nr:DUF5117 domain-containing protein [Rhodothermales bacterium]
MSRIAVSVTALLVVISWCPSNVTAQSLPTIESRTDGLDRSEGFFPLYWDSRTGTVLLEIGRFGEDLLYMESLASGLGSNDIGLDRGQLGRRMIVRFERIGPRVFLVAPNLKYRADGALDAEALTVSDAFADGVEWAFDVAAETGGRVLVDATPFLLRDVHGIQLALDRSRQGKYKLDTDRSTLVPKMLKTFPDNTELETLLTFGLANPGSADSQPGAFVRSTVALPTAISIRVRHSLIRLPGPGYVPRLNHPRSGFSGIEYRDYAAEIGSDMTRRFLARHRLEKTTPGAAPSEVVKPIVYYLDAGTPEPVRSALLDGASWWADAFESAGFLNAFRVEILPDGADPLDIRYNVIQWVHRATRGWSYGASVVDPRTGEILKGHVSLGSLRVRQDYLIAEGLLTPYVGEHEKGFAPDDDPMLRMALARIRQLSAHEVGHTLGLMHNFAASTYGRASVMDYPAPLVGLGEDDELVLDDAYAVGVGSWDRMAIRFGYGSPSDAMTEAMYLNELLREASSQGLLYLPDSDARSDGTMQPAGNLWDNGADPVSALRHEMEVRRRALSRFGESAIRVGQQLALQEEVLVPLYLHNRYQLAATSKLIGGMYYQHAARGEETAQMTVVSAAVQREALRTILQTLQPAALRVPSQLRLSIAPRPPGYPQTRELFSSRTTYAFNSYLPVELLATITFDLLLNPHRTTRLVHQHDFDGETPGLTEVLRQVAAEVWSEPVTANDYDAEIERVVQQVWLDALITSSEDATTPAAVRARLQRAIQELRAWIEENPGSDDETVSHREYVGHVIGRHLAKDRGSAPAGRRVRIPPGSPIGSDYEGASTRHLLRREMVDELAPASIGCSSEGAIH